jgi:hypothetical protein
MANSIVAGIYDKSEDRQSAYEHLKGRVEKTAVTESASSRRAGGDETVQAQSPAGGGFGDALGGLFGGGSSARRKDTIVEAVAKSVARSVGSQVGRAIVRGMLGSIMKK